jgi:hypothetical protein
LDDWIYCTLYIQTIQDYMQYGAIAILHTIQFSVTHALGFSTFTGRILATDLSQSHCNFNSHVKSPWHGLNPILPLLQLPIRKTARLDSTTLLYSFASSMLFYNPSARTPRITPSSIVKNACLLVRYLAMNVLLLSRALVLRECV